MRHWMIGVALLASGCVGSAIHSSAHYQSVQSTIADNNQRMMDLRVGMSRHDAMALLGAPERSEGYPWGTVLLYRTAMTSGVYGTQDSDFTPVVFDQDGWLVGWGRNFFVERAKRYEIEIARPASGSK